MLARLEERLPSPLTLFFVALGAIGIAVAFLKGIQDPDYFWHLETGEWIVERGFPDRDPFSFTYGGEWTLHEWLGQVLIHLLDTWLGPTWSLALFALIPPAALAVLATALARQGLQPRAIVIASVICGAVLFPYVTIRPQVISWLFLAVTVALLIQLKPGRTWPAFVLPPLFALWANVHGLYVIGLGVVGLYVLATAMHRTPMASRIRPVLVTGVVTILASALTPSGPPGLLYPLRYVDAGDWGLANIPEWQSPNFHDAVQLPLLMLILVLAVVPKERRPAWIFALAYVSVVGALLANRNAPVAAVASLPALAFGIASVLPVSAATDQRGRRVLEAGTVCLLILAVVLTVPNTSGASGVSLQRYPAAGVSVLRDSSVDRVIVEYGWGGYVIRELADDGVRVFVDGRNDMYPEELLNAYSAVRAGDAGWDAIVEAYQVDALLFPPDAPIARGVARSAGWCDAMRTESQVVLVPCG